MELKELKQILKRLFREYIRKHLKKIFISLILSLIVAGSTSGIAWLLDPAVKKIFIDQDKLYAWTIPLLIILAFAGKGISLYLARINLIRVGEEVCGELQKKIATNILTSDIQTLDSRHSGKYISNIMFDSHHVKSLVSTGVLNLMKDTFSVIALVTLMFYQNWKLASFAILMMPLAGGLAKSLGKRISKATVQAGDSSGKLVSFLSEVFKGARMIRIYQKENVENKKATLVIDDLVEKNIKIASVIIRATPLMEILTGFMIAGFIFFSGKLISSGELGINNFFSFLAAMMLAYQPIRSLATLNLAVYQGASAFKRIGEVIDKKVNTEPNENGPDLIIKNSDILFNNVNFKYETTNEKAVNNVNIDIKGNTITAFVGHSGAGKSTIINLLPRFYDPQDGVIQIDNQDISKISLKSLRKNISLVSQDVVLFDDTIINNIKFAKEEASLEDVKKACKFAAADEFIEKLPNQYNTIVGENGIRLSGGQKQRISIARAILKESPIILLDEATSSLDADSEEIVQHAIKNLTKNKTTLVIAHRLSTIHDANKIFVLKEGKIVNSGNHNFLMDECEEYKSLYKKQLK
ncbi:ABC transporter ATP-binding protein/permease [Pelagibacteraceae bacterium]|nr:ABC transporter ATP-binding protein/permease [Pelagibacteraceae bacterium]